MNNIEAASAALVLAARRPELLDALDGLVAEIDRNGITETEYRCLCNLIGFRKDFFDLGRGQNAVIAENHHQPGINGL